MQIFKYCIGIRAETSWTRLSIKLWSSSSISKKNLRKICHLRMQRNFHLMSLSNYEGRSRMWRHWIKKKVYHQHVQKRLYWGHWVLVLGNRWSTVNFIAWGRNFVWPLGSAATSLHSEIEVSSSTTCYAVGFFYNELFKGIYGLEFSVFQYIYIYIYIYCPRSVLYCLWMRPIEWFQNTPPAEHSYSELPTICTLLTTRKGRPSNYVRVPTCAPNIRWLSGSPYTELITFQGKPVNCVRVPMCDPK